MDVPLSLEYDRDVAFLRIEGAPSNELTFDFFDALGELLTEKLPELDVSGLIVAGRGRHFSSGSNIEELLTRSRGGENESSP